MALFCVRHRTKDAEGTTTVSACPYACDGTPMTVRGGGIPRRPLALTPNGRMGPPLRSFAADAHDCIMVRRPSVTWRIASGRREREGMVLTRASLTCGSVPPRRMQLRVDCASR